MPIYDYIYRYAVFPLMQKWNGSNLFHSLKQLNADLSRPDKIESIQLERLRLILKNAAEHCDYWRDLFRDYQFDPGNVQSVSDLKALPSLSKDTVRSHLESISARNLADVRLSSQTGGSTAAPLKFYRDPECASFREAVRAHFWSSIGKQPHDRWTTVWGSMSDLGGYSSIKTRLKARLGRRLVFVPANQIDENSIKNFAKEIHRFRPKLLHGYSQALYLFCRLLDDQKLTLPDSVQAISTTAEPLYEEQKSFLESYSNRPVYRVYGTREFGFLGVESPGQEGLVINPINAFIEIVDNQGNPVKNGEKGQILVTDLSNLATPLIRYQIGDICSWKNSQLTPDQWQSINIEAGRVSDFVLSKKGRLVGGVSMSLISSPGISQLQFVQKIKDELTVRYVRNEKFESKDLQSLRKQTEEILGDLEIRFEECANIERTKSGKIRNVISEVSRQMLDIKQD